MRVSRWSLILNSVKRKNITRILAFTGAQLVTFLLCLSTLAGHQKNLTVFYANDSTRVLQEQINEICHNPPETKMQGAEHCEKGTAALKDIKQLLKGEITTAEKNWIAFHKEMPMAMQDRIDEKCGRSSDLGKQLTCAENLAWLRDRKMYDAAIESNFNWSAMYDALQSWKNSVTRMSILSLSCRQVQGEISVTLDTKKKQATATDLKKANDPECVPSPNYAERIAYQPTPISNQDPLSGAKGEEPVDPLALYFDSYQKQLSSYPVKCPDYIPRVFCEGSKYDPVQIAVRDPAEPQTEWIERVEKTLEPAFESDVARFVADVFADKYVQAVLLSEGAASHTRLEALKLKLRCIDPQSTILARIEGNVAQLNPAQIQLAGKALPGKMVQAGECLKSGVEQLKTLQNELGLDIEMTTPILRDRDLRSLPVGIRHLVNGVTGLPVLRHFLRETPFVVGATEASKRECGYVRTQVDQLKTLPDGTRVSRAQYCENRYREFAALSFEMNALYTAYPLLAEKNPDGRKILETLSYPLNAPKKTPAGVGLDDQCMDRTAEPSVDNLNKVQGAISAHTREQLGSILNAIESLCDPKSRKLLMGEVLQSSEFMNAYFSCETSHLSMVQLMANMDSDNRVSGLSASECANRRGSAWLACRQLRDQVADQKNTRNKGHLLQLAMDSLFFLSPGVSGKLPGIGGITRSMILGGTLGYALTPSGDEEKKRAEFRAAAFRSGLQDEQQFSQALDALKEEDKELDGLITGLAMGLVTGVLQETSPIIESSAAAENLIIESYRKAKVEGKFKDGASKLREQKVIAYLDARIRTRFPEFKAETVLEMPVEEKITLLSGETFGTKPAPLPAKGYSEPLFLEKPEVRQFIRENIRYEGLTERDNRSYINRMTRGEGKLYFESESAILKQLNDKVVKNRSLVQSLENRYRAILVEKISQNQLIKGKLLAKYGDYKSVRLIFSEDSTELRSELSRIFSETAFQFESELQNTPMRDLYLNQRGIAGDPKAWHLAGFGKTLDEANSSARAARARFPTGANHMPEVILPHDFAIEKSVLDAKVARIESLREALQAELGSGQIMTPTKGGANRLILSADAIELLKKVEASSLEEYRQNLRQKFKNRFQVELNDNQIDHLRDYYHLADSFAAAIVDSTRTSMSVSQASSGLISVDFAGQGARGLHETLETLANSDGTAAGVINQGRETFGRAAGKMKLLRKRFLDASRAELSADKEGKFLFSGDDGIYLPERALTQKAKLRFLTALSRKNQNASSFRVAFITSRFVEGGRIPPAVNAALVAEAEGVEKALRASLEGQVVFAEAKRLAFGIDYIPSEAGGGKMKLLIGADQISPENLLLIEKSFRDSLPKSVEFDGVVQSTPVKPKIPDAR